jgi:hypothetical protein
MVHPVAFIVFVSLLLDILDTDALRSTESLLSDGTTNLAMPQDGLVCGS